MRRKSTFVLTILPAETSGNELHGSLRTVADGSQATFSSLEELYQLIHKAIIVQDDETGQNRPAVNVNPSQSF
jgi:lipopolysaccharide export system protein LptA